MSWLPKTILVRGYKIPRAIWNEGLEKCGDLEKYEDMFIDLDPVCGQGDTLFGHCIMTVEEGFAQNCYEINLSWEELMNIKDTFYEIFEELYKKYNLYIPSCSVTYVGIRWT